MSITELKEKFEAKTIGLEELLKKLTLIGYCPILAFDDNGHWAMTFDGLQNTIQGPEPQDLAATNFFNREFFQPTVRAAVINCLQQYD